MKYVLLYKNIEFLVFCMYIGTIHIREVKLGKVNNFFRLKNSPKSKIHIYMHYPGRNGKRHIKNKNILKYYI